jgi:adenylylsulfate kinase-like enzyme
MAGQVIWITGLSGAGKSTVSEELCLRFRERGLRPVLLDGEILRNLFKNTKAPPITVKQEFN